MISSAGIEQDDLKSRVFIAIYELLLTWIGFRVSKIGVDHSFKSQDTNSCASVLVSRSGCI